MDASVSAGAGFRAALTAESPLQVMGAITAYAGLMARRTGYNALYLSGGGVAANSLGVPDLGISTMEDVLIDAPPVVDATGMRCWARSTPDGEGRFTSRPPSAPSNAYAVAPFQWAAPPGA